MNLLQTSNGRVRIDPEEIVAIETELIGQDAGRNLANVQLRSGMAVYCSPEEAVEIALQWEEYWDDEDDGPDDEDDADTAPLEIPETIDITPRPQSRMMRRKGKSHE